jgi:hypothetical protein
VLTARRVVRGRALRHAYHRGGVTAVIYRVDMTNCFPGSSRPLMVIMDADDTDSLYRLGKCFPRGDVTFNVINGSSSYQLYYLRNGGE